jgi:TRAP-type transport system periplasmic protein
MTGLFLRAFVAALALLAGLTQANSSRELRLSHQWPETDARHKATRVLVAELRKRAPDLTIAIHPNLSLKLKPVEQFDALVEGKIDFAVVPIAYASRKIPEMSIGGLPGVPTNYEAAGLLKGSVFEEKLQQLCEENGFRVLTWWWVGGAFVSRERPIGAPEDVKGLPARGGDNAFDWMLGAAGAKVLTMPSSEIYPAMASGKLDIALSSLESFMSFRVPELTKFARFGGYAVFTVMTPVLVSKSAWDSLTDDQRQALREAAAASDVYFEATQREAEETAIAAFTKAGAKVDPLTFEEYAAWLHLARGSSWKNYQAISPRAVELFTALLQSFIDSGKR